MREFLCYFSLDLLRELLGEGKLVGPALQIVAPLLLSVLAEVVCLGASTHAWCTS